MAKIMFSTQNLRNVFAAEDKYDMFRDICSNLIRGEACFGVNEDGERVQLSVKEANKVVRKVLLEVCGLNEETVKSDKLRKRAIKDHMSELFEIIEDDVEFKVWTGMDENEWFNRFVETRNEALGDDTEFEVAQDDVTFIVAEISGDHHDFNLCYKYCA